MTVAFVVAATGEDCRRAGLARGTRLVVGGNNIRVPAGIGNGTRVGVSPPERIPTDGNVFVGGNIIREDDDDGGVAGMGADHGDELAAGTQTAATAATCDGVDAD